MRALILVSATVCAAASSACFLPSRDNPTDPAVRPRPVIAVRVDGQDTGGQGGRHAVWALDGSQSSDPNGTVAAWEWSMSATQTAPDDESGWIAIGVGSTLVSSNGSLFAATLAGVADFASLDGAPGVGNADRWVRLVIEDDAGVRASTERSISLVNRAPVVSLGGNRRITVGGKWWEAAGDAARAPAREIVLEVAVSDADGDDALLFSATNPPTWTVSGELGTRLDLDGDGFVDTGLEEGGRRLRFAASVLASSSRIGLSVSDVTSGTTVIGGTATDEIQIDVRSNAWVFDAASGVLSRLNGSFSTGIGFAAGELQLLASSEDRILVLEAGIPPRLRVVDVGLVERVSGDLMSGFGDELGGLADGNGGWWVYDPYGRELSRYDAQLSLVAGPVSQVTSAAGIDDLYGGAAEMTRVANGSDVWVVGGPFSAPSSRVLRVSTAMTVVASASISPLGSYAMAPDPDGGVWIVGTNSDGAVPVGTLQKVTAGGTLMPATTLPPACDGNQGFRLARDPVAGTLWVAASGGGLCSFDAGASDVAVLRNSLALLARPGSLLADPTDGNVLLLYETPSVITRFTPDLDSIGSTPAVPEATALAASMLPGGSLVLSLRGGSGAKLQLLERAEVFVPLLVPTGVDPLSVNAAMTVDPDTGSAWLWRSDCGCLERYGADGTLAEVVDVPGSTGGDGAIAIAPAAGSLHLAWAPPAGITGKVISMALGGAPGSTRVLIERPGITMRSVGDLSVSPDGATLCVGGTPAGSDPLRGPGVRLAAGSLPQIALTNTSAMPSLEAYEVASAISSAGECWFSANTPDPDPSALFAHVDTQGAVQTRSARSMVLRAMVALPWDDSLRPIAFNPYDITFLGDWLPFVDANGIARPNPVRPSVSEFGGYLDQANDIAIEPLYRHLFVGFGDQFALNPVAGRVVRFAPDPNDAGRFSEVARTEELATPVLW